MSDYLTTTQLAKALNTTENHILRLARARTIPGLRLGHQWRFVLADVIEALRKPAQL